MLKLFYYFTTILLLLIYQMHTHPRQYKVYRDIRHLKDAFKTSFKRFLQIYL